jgi:hypothetical protein
MWILEERSGVGPVRLLVRAVAGLLSATARPNIVQKTLLVPRSHESTAGVHFFRIPRKHLTFFPKNTSKTSGFSAARDSSSRNSSAKLLEEADPKVPSSNSSISCLDDTAWCQKKKNGP